MQIQPLLISVLITCVIVGATFLYFRNRIQRTEQKIDLMFNLIQEHENTAKLRQQIQPAQYSQSQINANDVNENFSENSTELINISDDENDDEYDSDDSYDSEEVSDADEDTLIIDNDSENKELIESHIKTISLSLEGAEISSKDMELTEVSNLEGTVMTDDSQNEDGSQNNDEEGDGDDGDVEEDDDLDDIALSDDNDANNAVSTETKDDHFSKNIVLEETNNDAKILDYSKLNKKKLVELANEKGMNTKGLKKSALVELLNESE